MNNLKQGGVLPKTNRGDSPVVITTQAEDGTFKARLFPSDGQANEMMAKLKASYGVDYTTEDGFHSLKGSDYRLLQFEDALQLDGRIVWLVSHTAFFPGLHGERNTVNAFKRRGEADDYLEELLKHYQWQASRVSEAHIERDALSFNVIDKGSLAVRVEMKPITIGSADRRSDVFLPGFQNLVYKLSQNGDEDETLLKYL